MVNLDENWDNIKTDLKHLKCRLDFNCSGYGLVAQNLELDAWWGS
jgi:hypothetical protein